MKALLTETLTIGLTILFGGQSMLAEESRSNAAIDIGSRLELFVDRQLVDRMDGVELRLHAPQKLPRAKSMFRGHYATVIKDGDRYRAYYRGNDPSYKGKRGYSGHPGETTCYAESRDGHEWTFPSLGLYEVNGTRDNNVILFGQSPFSHNFSPFPDTRPGADSDARFKALAGHPGYERRVRADGLHSFASADGIHWRRTSDEPVIPYDPAWPHGFDSQNVSFWSEAEQLYVCYFRTWLTQHGKLRTISRTTSPDFENWSKPVAMEPNLPGEHLYTNQTHPYFRAPHIYIALPTRFVPGRGDSPKYDKKDDNATDILFMSTRAGSTKYDRVFTGAFIRPGLDPARWRNRSNYVALNVVPTGPAEMSIYHYSSDRYVLRTDGFISVNAGAEQGELLTKPLTFSGNELRLNFSTSAAGSLRVEIQDADGEPIPGFALADATDLFGDEINGTYSWKSGADVSSLVGKPVRLRLVMRDADLYSFRFGN